MSEIVAQEGELEGVGHLKLFTRTWRPEGKIRGVVIIVHGFLAHSGRYQWVAEQLVQDGLAVYAFDLRGHGKSGGDRYWVDHFADYETDLAEFVELVKSREPGLPTFVLGHSAGGVIATLYALHHQSEVTGLIAESFAFETPPPELILTALKGIAHILPHAAVLALKPEDFSRDPKVVEDMKNDPLIIHTPGPAQTLAELIRAHDELAQSFGTITLPVLIIHGTADKATKPHGSQRFFDETGSTDKTLKLYEGHFHDLLSDLGKEEVMGDIVTWINARIPGA
ncbi:MAG TPA: alpha/beta hydrolase [Thermoanaerobaculia bacterium]|nr:alpha/beta hydrolase [Thermoanaerobaculia bacterium]